MLGDAVLAIVDVEPSVVVVVVVVVVVAAGVAGVLVMGSSVLSSCTVVASY